jgi:hypothetical protein
MRKLEFYREGASEKHLRDIRSILALSGALLDRSTLPIESLLLSGKENVAIQKLLDLRLRERL